MNSINVPKRKKDIDCSTSKRPQSQELFNKTTKRKPMKKNLLSTMATKSTLAHSSSMTKLKTPNKKSKNKNTMSAKKLQRVEKQNKKVARDLSIKTTKKSSTKKKKQIIQKQQELTERKKIHLEYFMYKDTYLPIENTEQRKIIYKIQLIDEKALQSQGNVKKSIKMVQKATQVQNKTLVDTATQRTDRRLYNVDFQCQTEQQKQKENLRSSIQSQQQPETQKCFAETLSELEFLYLPDQKNFEGFTKTEKAHYKELLMYIARKFDDQQEIPLYDEPTIEMFLKERQMKQRGIIQSFPKKGFPTHTPAIISYIANLFCYLQIHQRSNLVDRINCSYGYDLLEKFQRVRTGKTTKRPAPLIPESTFWRFQTQLHQGLPISEENFEDFLHAHNRAIFDATNEILLEFQPYYHSQGEPFPWSCNYETTFFCITQQNFGALAGQVKDRIWQYSNYLAGVLLEVSAEHKYKIHIHKILMNETKMLNTETKKYTETVQLDEQKTRMLCEISDQLQKDLIYQLVLILCS